MTNGFRIRPEGDAALIVEFADRIDPAVNARAQALAKSIDALPLDGILDVVPAYRSVAVYFDTVRSDVDRLIEALGREAPQTAATGPPGKLVRIPVCYGGIFGSDLADVAAYAGLTSDQVVALHSGGTYRVFMLGFVPGFAYLGPVDARIAAPRRATPRVRVPAGSVGIAGSETAVYPFETPAGWQIIGRTPLKPFDGSHEDPFLLKPGDAVQFYPIESSEFERASEAESASDRARHATQTPKSPCFHVVKPGLFTTVQDCGRWGWQSFGVPVAGPMDPYSHRVANLLVGNTSDAATLELTLVGPELEFEDERAVAVAGAEFALTVDRRTAPSQAAFLVTAGTRLRLGECQHGCRGYLAVSGGITVAPVFGSRATHVASRMGGFEGRPLRASDRVPLGDHRPGQVREALRNPSRSGADSVDFRSSPRAEPRRVRILPGPHVDRFVGGALDVLQSAPYTIGQNSDRIGFRLDGPILRHAGGAEIISEATPLGTIQVPASGQPVLLMADRQTTGGYTKIATVISADLQVAGQLAPGDRILFDLCTMKDAVGALIAQESSLMALER